MGNGNIGVGKKTPTRHLGTPIVEAGTDGSSEPQTGMQPPKTERRGIGAFSSEVGAGSRQENASNKEIEPPFRFNRNGKGSSGAMSQQRGDSGRGNYSVPQELLQLVGCRDLKARPEPWVRPRFIPAKQ